MPAYTFSVIIPVYNAWKMTYNCLLSLREHTPGTVEVIVVDNASTDATPAQLPILGEALFPGSFRYIRNQVNRNFAGACNQGARLATNSLLFFLNNDTLLTPGWAPPLEAALRDDTTLGAVGPLLLYPSDLVQHVGAAHSPQSLVGHLYRFFPRIHPLVHKVRFLNVITAAALMLRAGDFFAVGEFHEGYVNGFEDVELSCCLRRAGFRLRVIPDSVVYHLEGQSPGRKEQDTANRQLMAGRCPDGIRPDMHHIVMDDGYLPLMTEDLRMKITLTPEREAYLAALAGRDPDIETCLALLKEEPYWEAGHDSVQRILKAAGRHAEALVLLDSKVRFFPFQETFRQALLCLQQLGCDAVEEDRDYLVRRVAETTAFLADRLTVAGLFSCMLENAAYYEDQALLTLLKTWRKSYGAQYLAGTQ